MSDPKTRRRWRGHSARLGSTSMLFFLGLTCIGAGGVLAVRAQRHMSARKKIELISGLLLMAGLAMIGWGLNIRLR